MCGSLGLYASSYAASNGWRRNLETWEKILERQRERLIQGFYDLEGMCYLPKKNLILSGSVGGQGWFLYSCEGFRLWESVSALFPKFFQKVAIHSWLINILTPLPFRGYIGKLACPMPNPPQFQIVCYVLYVNRPTYPPLLPVHRPPPVQFFWLFTQKLLSFVRLIYLIPSKTHGEISVFLFLKYLTT